MQPAMGPVAIDGKPIDGKSVGDALLALGRQALGSEEGKGPLPWPSFQSLVRERWQGPLAKEQAPGSTPVEFWGEALRRGGVFWNAPEVPVTVRRSEEHTSELQSLRHLVCRLLLEKKKKHNK